MLQALPGYWELQEGDRTVLSLFFFFQAVTHWTVSVALRWTCRPTGCQKYFSLVAVGEPSALTSSGLAATTVSVNASLALKCMLLPCLQEVF